MALRVWVPVALGLVLGTLGCDLQEITLADVTDVVVAEVYVTIGDSAADNRVRAFLHGTPAGGAEGTATFDDATVRVSRSDGLTFDLAVDSLGECVVTEPENSGGTCFVADSAEEAALAAGDRLTLRIVLGGGGVIDGATRVPGDFRLDGLGVACRIPPDTTMTVRWSPSEGAWAYVNETVIVGLPAALAPEGIEAEDSLYLLGLSISASDTTVVFPSEFGVFDRFDLDQNLAVRLQRGLPDSTSAAVAISATDRNYVNWARGGNFNPSGQVRVSSLRGAGSGVFGSAVVRRFDVVSSSEAGAGLSDCPLP